MFGGIHGVRITNARAIHLSTSQKFLPISKKLFDFKNMQKIEQEHFLTVSLAKKLLAQQKLPDGFFKSENIERITELLREDGHFSNAYPFEFTPGEDRLGRLIYAYPFDFKNPEVHALLNTIDEQIHIRMNYTYPFDAERQNELGFNDRKLFIQMLKDEQNSIVSDRHILNDHNHILFPGCSNLGPMLEAMASAEEAGFSLGKDIFLHGCDINLFQMKKGVAVGLAIGIPEEIFSLQQANVFSPHFAHLRENICFAHQADSLTIVSLLSPCFSPEANRELMENCNKSMRKGDLMVLLFPSLSTNNSHLEAIRKDARLYGASCKEETNQSVVFYHRDRSDFVVQGFYDPSFMLANAPKFWEVIKQYSNDTHTALIFRKLNE